MKFLHLILLATAAQASWFGSDKAEYTSWDDAQLSAWLKQHSIEVPKGYSSKDLQALVKANWDASNAWTQDQYEKAQKIFQDVKSDSFKEWDDSKLRKFLVEQGIANPSGPKESLEALARSQYASYTSYASVASASASTLLYGDKTHQASKSVSSVASAASSSASSAASSASSYAAQATAELARKINDSQDYVYSTWSDSELRSYLEKKGVVSPPASTRQQLIAQVAGTYDSAWESWTDSYIHDWLVSHNIIRSETEKKRDEYTKLMKSYYYDANGKVWDSWSDSDMRQWLLEHNVIKTGAQIQREKMVKLVKDNYNSAVDVIYAGWTESDIRAWLIDHGYIRSDAQVKRDELLKLMNDKYSSVSTKTADYLTWPDARLRAYLRNHDLDRLESALPTTRPGLVQEVRIKWTQSTSAAGATYARLRELVNSGVEFAEDKIGAALAILTGTAQDASKAGKKTAANLVKDYHVQLAAAEKTLSSVSAEAAKASKTANAKVVKEHNVKVASASSIVSSLSAEVAKASKRAKAEL